MAAVVVLFMGIVTAVLATPLTRLGRGGSVRVTSDLTILNPDGGVDFTVETKTRIQFPFSASPRLNYTGAGATDEQRQQLLQALGITGSAAGALSDNDVSFILRLFSIFYIDNVLNNSPDKSFQEVLDDLAKEDEASLVNAILEFVQSAVSNNTSGVVRETNRGLKEIFRRAQNYDDDYEDYDVANSTDLDPLFIFPLFFYLDTDYPQGGRRNTIEEVFDDFNKQVHNNATDVEKLFNVLLNITQNATENNSTGRPADDQSLLNTIIDLLQSSVVNATTGAARETNRGLKEILRRENSYDYSYDDEDANSTDVFDPLFIFEILLYTGIQLTADGPRQPFEGFMSRLEDNMLTQIGDEDELFETALDTANGILSGDSAGGSADASSTGTARRSSGLSTGSTRGLGGLVENLTGSLGGLNGRFSRGGGKKVLACLDTY